MELDDLEEGSRENTADLLQDREPDCKEAQLIPGILEMSGNRLEDLDSPDQAGRRVVGCVLDLEDTGTAGTARSYGGGRRWASTGTASQTF